MTRVSQSEHGSENYSCTFWAGCRGHSMSLFPLPQTDKATEIRKKSHNFKGSENFRGLNQLKSTERKPFQGELMNISNFFFHWGHLKNLIVGWELPIQDRVNRQKGRETSKFLAVIWTQSYLLENLEGFKGMAPWNIYCIESLWGSLENWAEIFVKKEWNLTRGEENRPMEQEVYLKINARNRPRDNSDIGIGI